MGIVTSVWDLGDPAFHDGFLAPRQHYRPAHSFMEVPPNTGPRFQLQKYRRPQDRYTCPACGRPRCYTMYVDTYYGVQIPFEYGRCDHENSCGYHRYPSGYTDDSELIYQSIARYKKRPPVPQPNPEPSFVPRELVEATTRNWHYPINPLFWFLRSKFGELLVRRTFEKYKVGTSRMWDGATIFWQHDIQGRCRTGKIMGYDPRTGHRIKEPRPQVSWAHTMLEGVDFRDPTMKSPPSDFVLEQCYFGEHLINPYSEMKLPIHIVESEKTALIAALDQPERVWIATGGISNLRPSKALRDFKVILHPDLGAEKKWADKAPALKEGGCLSVELDDSLSQQATEEQRKLGLDLADFILLNK